MMNNLDYYKDLLNKVNKLSLVEIQKINEVENETFKMVKTAKTSFEKKQEKIKKDKSISKYKYPFIVHFGGRNIETDHIFAEGQSYTEEQIRKKMLEHRYYEFSGTVKFEYIKKENVLLPIFQQHKKG